MPILGATSMLVGASCIDTGRSQWANPSVGEALVGRRRVRSACWTVTGAGVTDGASVGAVEEQTSRFIPACAGKRGSYQRTSAMLAVHPCVCWEEGGGSESYALGDIGSGPSLRVRGGEFRPVPVSSLRRFIPACAGRGQAVVVGRVCRAVHPCVCGEGTWDYRYRIGGTGSSLRVRGVDLIVVGVCGAAGRVRPTAGQRWCVHSPGGRLGHSGGRASQNSDG